MVIVFDSVSLHMFLEAIVSVILCLSIGRTIGRAFGVVKQGEVVYEPSMLIYDFPLTIRGLLLWVGVVGRSHCTSLVELVESTPASPGQFIQPQKTWSATIPIFGSQVVKLPSGQHQLLNLNSVSPQPAL